MNFATKRSWTLHSEEAKKMISCNCNLFIQMIALGSVRWASRELRFTASAAPLNVFLCSKRISVTVRRSEVSAVAFLQKAVARACAVVLGDVSALCTRQAHTAPPKAFSAVVGLGWLSNALASRGTSFARDFHSLKLRIFHSEWKVSPIGSPFCRSCTSEKWREKMKK